MASVISVVPGPWIFWDRWHEFHTTAGKGSRGDGALRIFMDDLPAGELFRVSAFGRSPVAIIAARHNAEKAGVHALLRDAPGAA